MIRDRERPADGLARQADGHHEESAPRQCCNEQGDQKHEAAHCRGYFEMDCGENRGRKEADFAGLSRKVHGPQSATKVVGLAKNGHRRRRAGRDQAGRNGKA